jgi:hypothetical protein
MLTVDQPSFLLEMFYCINVHTVEALIVDTKVGHAPPPGYTNLHQVNSNLLLFIKLFCTTSEFRPP